MQYFWFRHAFLLGPAGSAAVLGLATARLADPKLEVRDLAAATLSGEWGSQVVVVVWWWCDGA